MEVILVQILPNTNEMLVILISLIKIDTALKISCLSNLSSLLK